MKMLRISTVTLLISALFCSALAQQTTSTDATRKSILELLYETFGPFNPSQNGVSSVVQVQNEQPQRLVTFSTNRVREFQDTPVRSSTTLQKLRQNFPDSNQSPEPSSVFESFPPLFTPSNSVTPQTTSFSFPLANSFSTTESSVIQKRLTNPLKPIFFATSQVMFPEEINGGGSDSVQLPRSNPLLQPRQGISDFFAASRRGKQLDHRPAGRRIVEHPNMNSHLNFIPNGPRSERANLFNELSPYAFSVDSYIQNPMKNSPSSMLYGEMNSFSL